jgi:hypothetical protein
MELAESRYRGALLEGWLLKGALAVAAGDLPAARAALLRASTAAVETKRALSALAVVHLRLGETDDAVAALRTVSAKHRDDVATRRLLAQALVAADQLADRGINARVLDMHTVKPIDTEALARASRETGAFVVAEEHLHHGGLGSVVAATLAHVGPAPIEFVNLGDRYAESGKPDDLLRKYGMTADAIITAAESVLRRR